MDFNHFKLSVVALSAFTCLAAPVASAAQPGAELVQFDMPAITTAVDAIRDPHSLTLGHREVTFDLVLSSLINARHGELHESPPIDHLLVHCSTRDALPIVDYQPRTELQSDYVSPISISNKAEQTDSLGLNVDTQVHALGTGHFGSDETSKQMNSTEFQRTAPMQAVVASGTTNRGRGVTFKLRWTSQHVLEGEKHFRITIAVPDSWRGGLLDVDVTAVGRDRSLFGHDKIRSLAARHFVVAVYQQNDSLAAELSLKLARFDQTLVRLARASHREEEHAIAGFLSRLVPQPKKTPAQTNWYTRVTKNQVDPYTDKAISALPMAVRIAVLDYVDVREELEQLGQADEKADERATSLAAVSSGT